MVLFLAALLLLLLLLLKSDEILLLARIVSSANLTVAYEYHFLKGIPLLREGGI